MKETPAFAILREPFIAGTDENLSPVMHHLWKLEGGAIYFCRKGWAHATIDLKDYEIVKNTQVVLLPGTIICINGCSSDFTASFFEFPKEMFMEACMRFEPIFFRFIKEQPCYVLPQENTGAINGLIRATTAIYNDRENRFRNQIARNHLQSFMFDIYDKCYRYFGKHKIEGGTRQDEIFKSFVSLVHEHCASQREVSFYADKLCITPKYLSQVIHDISGHHASEWIRDYVILEAKALLKCGKYNVQQVSDLLNFANQSFFGSYFKKAVGCSPSAYQNS